MFCALGPWCLLLLLAAPLAAEPAVGVNMMESEPLFSGGVQFYLAHHHEFETRLFDGARTRANREGLFKVDHQLGLGVNWGVPRVIPGEWTLSAVVPIVFRDFRTVTQGGVVGDQLHGIGDIALGARMRYLWWVPGGDRGGEGASLSLACVTTLPTGDNNADRDGQRLPRDVQLGDGAVGLTFAHISAYSRNRMELISTSQYTWRSVGVGRSNYDFGDSFSHDFELKYRVIQEKFPGNTMFLVLGLAYQRTDFDRDDGRRVDDSGGQELILTPKIQWHPRPWWEMKAKFGVILWREVNGIQLGSELSVRASVSYRF